MILLVKDVKNLLSKKLSVSQRGLLITLMLCVDAVPEITLAKFKLHVKLKEHRKDLIYLHENSFIKWSGYAGAKKTEENSRDNQDFIEIATFMKELYGRGWSLKTALWDSLKSRMGEYTKEQIKLVISNRWEEWKDSEKMSKNLTPTTIFRPKLFEKYLEEAERTGKGEGIISVDKIGLKDGDEITFDKSTNLVDNDIYSVKYFNLDKSGKKKGYGKLQLIGGKELKREVRIQNNLEKGGNGKDIIYIFVKS